ncbi:MAG: hypothetical protein K2H64_10170 [Desulfovibrio sp.]|nr:hypothetical protein [Desulfovibrio sp.]
MSVDTTLAVLYAQSGLSTNIANAAMVAPQASLAMTRVLAAEALRQERDQVEKTEETEETTLHPDSEGKGAFSSRRRARRRETEIPDEPLRVTPFCGNLLNLKV